MATTVTEKSSTGLDANIAAALAYLGIPAVIFLAIEKDSQFVRFHSVQALFLALAWVVVWVALMIIGSIPLFGLLAIPLGFLVMIGFFIIWIIALIKAFQGEKYKFPVIGDLAEQQVSK
jgi:uncharacterized membrane protein